MKSRESNIYACVIAGLFIWAILVSNKYLQLKDAYKKAETSKVKFCKENTTLRMKIDTLENENFMLSVDNSRYLDYIQKIEE
jgi:hypothetical protein